MTNLVKRKNWILLSLYFLGELGQATAFLTGCNRKILKSSKGCLTLQAHQDGSMENTIIKTIRGPFSPDLFKSTNCWGRRPLLITAAFDTSQLLTHDEDSAWPSWNELLEIAVDEESGTRLIQHRTNELSSFTLDLGPFSESKVHALDASKESIDRKWTLVINDVERFHPALSDWMDDTFHFLPRWRLDDAQLSVAHKGGGIGPHVDNYDVFLIQASGKRVWEIGSEVVSVEREMESLIKGIDVRILGDWEQQRSNGKVSRIELEPGDALYLPPRFSHFGSALSNDCITLSVGCRAPSASDLVSSVAERLSGAITGSAVKRYVDDDLLTTPEAETNDLSSSKDDTGEITEDAKAKMKCLVRDAIDEVLDDDLVWDELVGKAVTECVRPRENYPAPLLQPDGSSFDVEWNKSLGEWGDPKAAVRNVIHGKGVLYRAEGVTFSFSSVGKHYRLFANGEMFEISSDKGDYVVLDIVSCIVNEPKLAAENFGDCLTKEIIGLLETLVAKGLLYGCDE